MFTVGIFSTHLPYLAFVFFYAFFFLFVNPGKASGEPDGEAALKTTTQHTYYYITSTEEDHNFDNDSTTGLYSDFNFEVFFKVKIKLFSFNFQKYLQNFSCFARFSRPPPAALLY